MSTEKIEIPRTEPVLVEIDSPKVSLGEVFDDFFPTRALQAAGLEAQRFMRLHPLENRTPDDPTLVETRFIAADSSDTEKELRKMEKRFPNLDEGVELLAEVWREHELHKFEKVTQIVPHRIMYDPIAAMVLTTKYRKQGDQAIGVPPFTIDEATKRQIMILSRQISYIDVKISFKKQISVYDLAIRHFCNIVQVTPDTPTTEPMRETHGREIDRDNMRAHLAKIAFLKTLAPVENLPVVDIMAPAGSVMKPFGDGLRANPITPNSFRLLKKDYENGVPILPIGFFADLKRSFIPFYASPPARFAVGKPIMPNQVLSDDQLYRQLSEGLYQVGQAVSDIPIYRS